MIPWQAGAALLAIGMLAGFGLRLLIDYCELSSYRRAAKEVHGDELAAAERAVKNIGDYALDNTGKTVILRSWAQKPATNSH